MPQTGKIKFEITCSKFYILFSIEEFYEYILG